MHRALLLAALAATLACGGSPGTGPTSPITSGQALTFADGTYRVMLFSRDGCSGATAEVLANVSVWARISAGSSPGTYIGRPVSPSGAFELRLNATGSPMQPPFQVPMTGSISGILQDEGMTSQIPPSGVRAEAPAAGSALGLQGHVSPGLTAQGVLLGPVQYSQGARTVSCASGAFILSGPLN